MVAIARPGVNFTDPREFDRSIVSAGNLEITDASGVFTASTAAGFGTEFALRGVLDTSNWTASTYKTILSVSSGIGLVLGMFGPTGLAGTPTTTFRITVDGIVYTIALVATAITQRAYLGPLVSSGGSSTGTYFTATGIAQRGHDALSADKTTHIYTTAVQVIPPISFARLFGMPGLRFNTSLLVEMQSSENNSTTTNKETSSGVMYTIMG